MFRKALLASQQAAKPALRAPHTSPLAHNIGTATATRSQGYSALAQESVVDRPPFVPMPGFIPDSTRGKVSFFNGTIDEGTPTLNFKPGEELATNIKPSFVTEVDVTDLRYFNPPASLAIEGCEWVKSPTQLTESMLDEPDKAKVDSVVRAFYLDECAKLVKDRTGAAKTMAYQFRHRKMEKGKFLCNQVRHRHQNSLFPTGLHPRSTVKVLAHKYNL